MNYRWLDGFLCAMPGAEFDHKPEWQWDRYQLRGKLFAAVCTPGPEHRDYAGHPLVNLKCDPARAELLRAEFPEILPGFYMDKRRWIAVLLDGSLPDGVLRELCAASYHLVLETLSKKVQSEISHI